jgi:hypothetical protein
MKALQARFELERQILALREHNNGEMPLVAELRLSPAEDHRHVEVCAELTDGCGELEVTYEQACDAESFDEAEERDRFLFMPSMLKH